MEKIFTEENMAQAVEHLLLKNDSCGIDGIMISEYKTYYELNGEKIRQELLSGKYEPDTVQMIEILMKNGKKRMISKYTCTDRVILDVLKNYLTPLWANEFSKYSYAYQENKGVQEAVRQCAKYIESGYQWVVEIDVKDFFGNINIEKMLSMIAKKIQNERLLKLLHSYLYIMVQEDGNKYRKKTGLIQGSPISPLFSNIYMDEFDRYMEKYHFCRFSDNINVYCDSMEKAECCMKDMENFLEKELGLRCNQDKSGMYSAL